MNDFADIGDVLGFTRGEKSEQFQAPELMQNYHTREMGTRLVENFLELVRDTVRAN